MNILVELWRSAPGWVPYLVYCGFFISLMVLVMLLICTITKK